MKVLEKRKPEAGKRLSSEWTDMSYCGGRNKEDGEFVQDMACGHCNCLFRISQTDMRSAGFLKTISEDEFECPSCSGKISNKIIRYYFDTNVGTVGTFDKLTAGEQDVLMALAHVKERDAINYSLRNQF